MSKNKEIVHKESGFSFYKKAVIQNDATDQAYIKNTLAYESMEQKQSEFDSVSSAFADMFMEVILQGKLSQKVGETYESALVGKKLSNSQKNKRAEAAREKITNQQNLMNERRIYLDKRKHDSDYMMAHYYVERGSLEKLESAMQRVDEEFKTPEEKEALENFMIKDGEIRRQLFTDNSVGLMDACVDIFKEMESVDMDMFKYDSDREFISEYGKKYDLLCKGASLKVFLDKYDSLREKGFAVNKEANVSLHELTAKAELFMMYKEDYEKRMELISSPFYALLAEKDVQGYEGERGQRKLERSGAGEDFMAYVKLYNELNQSRVGKGKDVSKMYAAMVKDAEEKQCRRDVELVRRFVKPYDEGAEGPEAVDRIQGRIEDEERNDLSRLTPGDYAKVVVDSDYAIENSGDNVGELLPFEMRVIKIITDGEIDGQKIKEEDMKALEWPFTFWARARQELTANLNARIFINGVSEGFCCDMSEAFKQTDEYKMLLRMHLKVEDTMGTLNGGDYDSLYFLREYEQQKLNINYKRSLCRIMYELYKKGYKVMPKQEEYLRKRAEGVARKEDPQDTGETVSFNGNTYKIFKILEERQPGIIEDADQSWLKELEGCEGKLSKTELEEAEGLLKEYTKTAREMLLSSASDYNAEFKLIINLEYEDKLIELKERITGITRRAEA